MRLGRASLSNPSQSKTAPYDEMSLQLRIFCFGLLKDGDVRVGIFPQREEVLIGGAGPGRIAFESVRTAEVEVGESTKGKIYDDPPMVNELLKFSRCLSALATPQKSLAANEDRIQASDGRTSPQFVRRSRLKKRDGLFGIVAA